MTPPSLAALLASSALALAVAAGWLLAAAGRILLNRWPPRSPRARAIVIAQLRLLPLTLPGVIVPLQIVAFARFEVGGTESAGPLLVSIALAGVLLVADSMMRGVSRVRSTRRVIAAWRASAIPIAVPLWCRPAWSIRRRYPVVAIVGVMRPQLFVARQVADACTDAELAAIAAHEAAHVQAFDNLLRALFAITPAARAMACIAEPLEEAWNAAAEEAADERARRLAPGLDLASALTKVARLAIGCAAEPTPASALIGSSQLQARVERLLEPASPHAGRSAWVWMPTFVLAALVLLIVSSPLLARLHDLFELLVRR